MGEQKHPQEFCLAGWAVFREIGRHRGRKALRPYIISIGTRVEFLADR